MSNLDDDTSNLLSILLLIIGYLFNELILKELTEKTIIVITHRVE